MVDVEVESSRESARLRPSSITTAWHKVESKLVNISTAEADENDLIQQLVKNGNKLLLGTADQTKG